jgi:hypothetical protein
LGVARLLNTLFRTACVILIEVVVKPAILQACVSG